jgi:hypothetical protein
MQKKDVNINVIRAVWRRTKKGHIKVRDLQPEKDVKGGSGVAGAIKTSSPITDASPQLPHHPPASPPFEAPRARWLHQLRKARDTMFRKLFEIPAEQDRKAHEERMANMRRVFLRWIKRR